MTTAPPRDREPKRPSAGRARQSASAPLRDDRRLRDALDERGQRSRNRDRVARGALSATGRAQAAELGERRRNDGIDVVYASDLQRAVQTAAIAFEGSDIPLRVDWRLRECDYGAMNGMPRSLLDEQRGSRIDEPWPGGESWRDAVTRVSSFLDDLRGGRVLMIGHVATRWALDCRVHGRTLEELAGEEFDWQPGWEYELRSGAILGPLPARRSDSVSNPTGSR